MQDLITKWKEGKEALNYECFSEGIIAIAKEKKRTVLYAHYGTIAVLTLTLIGIALFFYYVAPFREPLSKAGMWMMQGGLALRIIIEGVSIVKSAAIRLTATAAQTTQVAVSFYTFRKKIHGPMTMAIVVVYVLGFYFLSPEFSTYIPFHWMVMLHVSFILGAVFLVWVIKKGIKKEMSSLSHLTNLRKEIIAYDEAQTQ